MKKAIAMMLTTAMILGMTACGSGAAADAAADSAGEAVSEAAEAAEEAVSGTEEAAEEAVSEAAEEVTSEAAETAEEPAADYSGQTLVVQAWGGTYAQTMRDYAVPMFEEQTGATVEIVDGAAPLSQLATEGEEASIDVLSLDTFEVTQGNDMGVLEPLDLSKLKNTEDLYKEAFMYDTALVTNWGTYGIVYRADLVEKEPTSWLDLWDPAYAGGKVGVCDYSLGGGLEFVEAIAEIQGTNIADQDNWDNLFAKLAELKPSIGVYAAEHSDLESALTNGDVVISVETNGRAIGLMEEGLDVKFCQPEEGSIAMTSLAGIASGSTNKELAYIFLDILLSPEVQKAYAEINHYAPSNSKTEVKEELQAYMPYGQEQVSNLKYMDSEALEPVKADLIERWNKEFK